MAILLAPPAHAAQGETESGSVVSTSPRPASLVGFDPGNIIDDTVFAAKDSMSASEIQAFLNGKVPRCQSGYTCLKDFGQATSNRPADAMCPSPYTGKSWESAASIIYNVAQACGINPQVILVTLQKEQGLVTHTWPSDWRYTIAMGQGCPDTAACDTRYYGFFNQVYGAAWQLKRYANPPGTSQYFTWYAPGKTWNVRFHPDASCGSSPVYIQNQATANLYYYTPYQPNRASLAAGLGTGDACSSYGNRNFYNHFTDWFGSTRGTDLIIIKSESRPEVYLSSSGSRWHITTGEDYEELVGAFGPLRTVASSYLSGLKDAGRTGAILRDSRTGVIALVQGGRTHRFTSCDSVAQWGGSCTTPTNVDSSLLSRLAAGPEVGSYFRVRGSQTWGRFDGPAAATPLYNEAAARAASGQPAQPVSAPYLSSARYAALAKAPMRFAPAQLVRTPSDSRVFLTVGFNELRWVPRWSAVENYSRGPGDLALVTDAELSGYTQSGSVEPLMNCGGVTFVPARGVLHQIKNPAATGLAAMEVPPVTCEQFSKSSQSVDGLLAIKSPTSADVWTVSANTRRLALTWGALVAANAGVAPPVLTVAGDLITAVPEGSPLVDGAVVKSSSAPELYLGSGSQLHWIRSAGVAADLGLSLDHGTVAEARLRAFQIGAPLGLWIGCGNRAYFGAGGTLWPVTAEGAQGFVLTPLSPVTCAALSTQTDELPLVAVKSASSPDVYVAQSGSWRRMTSWEELVSANKGTAPRIHTISQSSFMALQIPAPPM
ncbi:hypothetical protein GCM10010461_23570 [Microbacterium aurantiacum]